MLAATKYLCRQNILVDKIIAVDKIYASTKLLALTKYQCRQNIGVDKIRAWTKPWRQQNLGADKKLAQTKRWHRRRRISLLLGSAESAATDFSQAPLKISYFSLMVLVRNTRLSYATPT
jgi:hypothetical protein